MLILATDTRLGAISECRRVAGLVGAPLRKASNLSQAEVALQIGTSAQSISNWERGLVKPTGDRAVRYLELLRELERLVLPGSAIA